MVERTDLAKRLRAAEKALDAARDLRDAAAWHVDGIFGDEELIAAARRLGRAITKFDRAVKRDA